MLVRQGHRLSKPQRSGGVWLRSQVLSGLSSTGGHCAWRGLPAAYQGFPQRRSWYRQGSLPRPFLKVNVGPLQHQQVKQLLGSLQIFPAPPPGWGWGRGKIRRSVWAKVRLRL